MKFEVRQVVINLSVIHVIGIFRGLALFAVRNPDSRTSVLLSWDSSLFQKAEPQQSGFVRGLHLAPLTIQNALLVPPGTQSTPRSFLCVFESMPYVHVFAAEKNHVG